MCQRVEYRTLCTRTRGSMGNKDQLLNDNVEKEKENKIKSLKNANKNYFTKKKKKNDIWCGMCTSVMLFSLLIRCGFITSRNICLFSPKNQKRIRQVLM